MSDARWIEVAQAVTDELNNPNLTWSKEFVAERNYADWDIPLEDLGTLRVDVVPVNNPETTLDDRGSVLFTVAVDIAIRYRFKQDELTTEGKVQTELADALSLFVQEVLVHFIQIDFETVADAKWLSTEILQTHGPESLLTNQQYTGIVRTTYQAPLSL